MIRIQPDDRTPERRAADERIAAEPHKPIPIVPEDTLLLPVEEHLKILWEKTVKEQNWSQDDVFPIIAQAIKSLHTTGREFVEHDDIVRFLMKDTEAANHIAAAREGNKTDRSDEWIAHNMVAWFSQRITIGDSPYVDCFERKKINNKWAYKPIP